MKHLQCLVYIVRWCSGEGNANVVSFRSVFQMTALEFSHTEGELGDNGFIIPEECCKIEGPG